VYNGVWSKAPRSWVIFRNFRVKSNLTVCKVTFNCKLQKKVGGAGCTSCSPNNFVGGTVAPPALLHVVINAVGRCKSNSRQRFVLSGMHNLHSATKTLSSSAVLHRPAGSLS